MTHQDDIRAAERAIEKRLLALSCVPLSALRDRDASTATEARIAQETADRRVQEWIRRIRQGLHA